jgi:hypothetical protein
VKIPRSNFACLILVSVFWMGCAQNSQTQSSRNQDSGNHRSRHRSDSRPSASAHQESNSQNGAHDLSVDESLGGHTLARHVGRTDEELRQRLEHEGHITAASTYTDRQTAEKTVAAAFEQQQSRIKSWLERADGHRNLVLDYDSSEPVGKTLFRNRTEAVPCSHAVVVLRWLNPEKFYVLTTYPECRS